MFVTHGDPAREKLKDKRALACFLLSLSESPAACHQPPRCRRPRLNWRERRRTA